MKKLFSVLAKTFLILLSLACIVAFVLAYLSMSGVFLFGQSDYLYYDDQVVRVGHIYRVVALFIFGITVTLIVIAVRSKSNTIHKIFSTVLLAALLAAYVFMSSMGFALYVVVGPYGCSYTEDIADYGVYDMGGIPNHFPKAITDEMHVVKYTYFYKYSDLSHWDYYLEVKFDDKATMEKYVTEAKGTFQSWREYQNPFNDKYIDILDYDGYGSPGWGGFGGSEDYKVTYIDHDAVIYSYEELTIIYTNTQLKEEIGVGDDPNRGFYYPQVLKRFGIEWDPDKDYGYGMMIGSSVETQQP